MKELEEKNIYESASDIWIAKCEFEVIAINDDKEFQISQVDILDGQILIKLDEI